MSSMTGGATIRPKRNRQRYNQIRYQLKGTIARRLEEQAALDKVTIETATFLATIRHALNLPLAEDEAKWVDYSILKQFPMTGSPAWFTQALKYLSPDFTVEKLRPLIRRYSFTHITLVDWLMVRWALVEVLEGRAHYDAIGSDFYGFLDGEFFFDNTKVVNPKGHTHTGWKLVQSEVKERPDFPSNTIEPEFPNWWGMVKKFLKAKCTHHQ
jgi:hypothetical protein